MNYVTDIKKIKKNDIFIILDKKYYLINKALNKGASKVICDIKFNNKKVKKVKNPYNYYYNKIILQNKMLEKYFYNILFINNKEDNDISRQILNYLTKKKEKVLIIKDNCYYLNKKKYELNEKIDIILINKLLKKAIKNNINYFCLDITSPIIDHDLINNFNFYLIALYNNGNKKYNKIIKRKTKYFITNIDLIENKVITKKIVNKLTVGKSGNFQINYLNNTFEYNYNIYNIKQSKKNQNSQKLVFIYSILSILGYDLNDVTK